MKILVLEASTTSAKAMYFCADTGGFEVKARTLEGMDSAAGLHDAQKVYRQMMLLGRNLLAGREPDAIALSDTWHSLLLCDRDGEPASPVYLWSWTKASGICGRLREDKVFVRAYHERTGCMVNAVYPYFKLLKLGKERSLSRFFIMGQGTYNTWKMTGRRVITECMASGSGLYHVGKRNFDDGLLREAGLRQEQMCVLTGERESFPLTAEAAGLLGVTAGIPVFPANSDGGLNQIGAGGGGPDTMTLSVGTSGAMRLSTEAADVGVPGLWCYRSPAGWLKGAAVSGCCNCLDWFRENMCRGQLTYRELEKGTPCETGGPVFLPFLFGERCPGWQDGRGGVFADVRPHHTPGDFYRAMQEGVLFNLYQCFLLMKGEGSGPEKVRLSGGILHSHVWSQMCADVFGMKMEVQDTEHVSLLGGAVWAACALGAMDSAGHYRGKIKKTIYPGVDNREYYRNQFEKYLELYRRENRRGQDEYFGNMENV